jgi:hypothetical protein
MALNEASEKKLKELLARKAAAPVEGATLRSAEDQLAMLEDKINEAVAGLGKKKGTDLQRSEEGLVKAAKLRDILTGKAPPPDADV